MAGKKSPAKKNRDSREAYYKSLFRRFVILTTISSIIPLLIVGWISNYHYSRFAKDRTHNYFQNQLAQHRKLVDLFLQEQISKLSIVLQINSAAFLSDETHLRKVFEKINIDNGAFIDLGMIDGNGGHLAYIGPHDLIHRNYSKSFWFQEIVKGKNGDVFISDMFLGFRKIPHFIIAVLKYEGNERYILRATINPDIFRNIVEDVKIGSAGEVFIVNKKGILQTNPVYGGKIMEKSAFPVMPYNTGVNIRVQRFGAADNTLQIAAYTWLENPGWMIVMRQKYSDALYDVNHANYILLLCVHLCALAILFAAIMITKYMIHIIRTQDAEVEHANAKFIQAGKLASVGELSAGVAHEINNPLAVILTEKQILADMEKQARDLPPEFREQLNKSLERISKQVRRCKRLTHNLLRFSRCAQSVIGDTDINTLISDVIDLIERDAVTSGVKIVLDLSDRLPSVMTDPSQLQQVFLNIITNAIDAHEGKPYGTIQIRTLAEMEKQGVSVEISDTGSGIPQEIIDKIFDPFFTTKPVGRGTGLGLSICYGIIKKLGGEITVTSQEGIGTKFTIFLSFEASIDLNENENVFATMSN